MKTEDGWQAEYAKMREYSPLALTIAGLVYPPGFIATFIYLMFFVPTDYNWWNWLPMTGINLFLAAIWPVYWAFLHWIP